MLGRAMRTPAQTIDPRDVGLRGLALQQPVFAADAHEKADRALEDMADHMLDWLRADIESLQLARTAAVGDGWDAASMETLHDVAHNLKGLGATYGFPLATQIAGSLCDLIENDAGKACVRADPKLALAHVDALRAVVRDDIRDEGHPVGRALLLELRRQVAALGVAPR